MPDVVKHGWTHRPKSQGGTDPIDIPSGLPAASAGDGQRSRTANGTLDMLFAFVYWNDDAYFDYAQTDGGTPNRAKYIILKQEGWYRCKFYVAWPTDLTAPTSLPFIQPKVWFPTSATAGTLVNSYDADGWDDTQGVIYGEQFTTDEAAHHQLVATIDFSFTEAQFGDSTIGVGLSIHTSASETNNYGAQMTIVRLGDALTQQTIT